VFTQSYSKASDALQQAQYLENIGQKKGQPSGSKKKYHQEDSKDGKKKWKGGKDKKTTTTTHQCKDPNNHYNHCNIDGHTEEKCWKLHPELNLKKCKKEKKKKNVLATYLSNQVERSSDVDGNIFCTSMHNEVNLSSLHHHEEKEMTKLFHIKIRVKKAKINAMFDSSS
jgi:hypothetical protein